MLNKNKLLGISDKIQFEVETPMFSLVHTFLEKNEPKATVDFLLTKKLMERYFIVYFHSLLHKFIYKGSFLEFSDQDQNFIFLYESFREINQIFSFDSFIDFFRKNKLSFKNLLRPIITNTEFAEFFINAFFSTVQQLSNVNSFITFDYLNKMNENFFQFEKAKPHLEVFLKKEDPDFGFLFKFFPKCKLQGNEISLEDLDPCYESFVNFMYGDQKLETSFIFYFYKKIKILFGLED